MKMLFRNGNIDKDERNVGINKIHFTTFETDVINDFDKSLWQVMGLLGRYDVEHYCRMNGKDVFYFYDQKNDKQVIVEELDNIILRDNVDSIANYEDTMIKEAIEDKNISFNKNYKSYVDETIFWDVLNHFVVIVGRDELVRFANAIEEERWTNYMAVLNDPDVSNFVREETMAEPVKKMILLSKQGSN